MDVLKKLSLVLSLALIVSLVGCGGGDTSSNVDLSDSSINTIVENKVDEFKVEDFVKEAQTVDEIVESADYDKCATIEDDNLKSECEFSIIIQSAKDSNNPSLCDKLNSSSALRKCKEEVEMFAS